MERIAKLFSEYLRAYGHGEARKLVSKHGGVMGEIDTIPVEHLRNFARELEMDLAVADHGERRDDLPESLEASDPKFADFHRRAFNKFNSPRRGEQ